MLIEQYLPNISAPAYSVHQSFMWFLWLNWRKATFYPVTSPNDSKCWPIVTSLIQEPNASNCDVSMTDCFRVVAMDAFLAHWNRKFITAQWSCFNFFVYFSNSVTPPVSTRGIASDIQWWLCNQNKSMMIDSTWAGNFKRLAACIHL